MKYTFLCRRGKKGDIIQPIIYDEEIPWGEGKIYTEFEVNGELIRYDERIPWYEIPLTCDEDLLWGQLAMEFSDGFEKNKLVGIKRSMYNYRFEKIKTDVCAFGVLLGNYCYYEVSPDLPFPDPPPYLKDIYL